MIRQVKKSDADAICNIYNYYVDNTIITFEEQPVSVGEICRRIDEVQKAFPWLVFETDGVVLGFAYASKWKGRCAYRYSVESAVYVAKDTTGRKIGEKLYGALISQLGEIGIHSVLGGIALPNAASVHLHEKMGFKKVAEFREVGWKFNKWIDVGYWQLVMPVKKC